ncbi:centrosomal protein of 131 kDa [Anopheles bellator]|uniref:centrosomal protein of 131 kDa n=1 Tax=Anopheles bellator TaxID=139047 RepID=UPI002649D967|nr:centrosomal protein of 131 kDa [Anopheles bellator]
MELSLYGSQISLATREKPNNTNQRERPGSALQHTRPYSGPGPHIRRPLSADSTQYPHRKRPSSCGSGSTGGRLTSPFHQLQHSKRSTSSSSLLLKHLLTEPTTRYWESKASPKLAGHPGAERVGQLRRQQTQPSLNSVRSAAAKSIPRKRSGNGSKGRPQKPKPGDRSRRARRRNSSEEEEEEEEEERESSMDEMEDTQESNNEAELEGIWRGKPGGRASDKKRSPPLPMVALPLHRKQGLGTGAKKNNNVSPETKARKLDLPGRVSFSSNDPYEIDYSDFEENEFGSLRASQPKPPRKGTVKGSSLKASDRKPAPFGDGSYTDEQLLEEVTVRFGGVKFEDDNTTSTSGYDTKCDDGKGALAKRGPSSPTSQATVCGVSESNRIIEDYKKEIEDLNRRHDMELRLAVHRTPGDVAGMTSSAKPYDPKCFTPSETPEDLFINSTSSTKAAESTAEDTDVELDRSCDRRQSRLLEKNVINEYYECINEIITEQSPSRRPQRTQPHEPDPTPPDAKEVASIQRNLNNESCAKTGPKDKQFVASSSSSGGSPASKGKSGGGDKNRLDSSANPVIKNYFKVKEQNIVSDSRSSMASGSAGSSSKSIGQPKNVLLSKRNAKEKPKSADTHKSILRNAKKQNNSVNGGSRKYSVGLCREDSNISEFHMDKVVSWMSCNEDTFPVNSEVAATLDEGRDELPRKSATRISSSPVTDTTADTSERPPPAYSATFADASRDPERHEQATNSSVQSNFDEDSVVSSSAKQKSDFQALKNEVEYRLSNILDCTDSQASSGCEGDPAGQQKGKAKDLFSYLDQVERKCGKSVYKGTAGSSVLPSDSERSEMEFAAEPDYIEAVPKMTDLLELPPHQLARRVIKLSLRANELSNAMQLSKDHIASVKADKVKAIRTEKCALQGKLKEQKKHYEDIIGRHQEFIDQLIKDKSGLCEKVTQLTRRLDSQNQSWEHRLKTELERARDTALAAEKIRREKWVRENTKKIKELTVKGLELEINKMTATHQKEIAELKRQSKDELVCALGELKLQYEQKEADVRAGLGKERETSLERERQALLERFDRQVTEERTIFEQQRQHLLSEFDLEKERLQKEAARKAQYAEAQLEELKRENSKNLDFAQKEYVQMLKQRETKHQDELTKLQKHFESDFAIWKREHERKSKAELEERENAIRGQCRDERNQQIDLIVAKVTAETQKQEQEFDTRMSRLKEKHEAEQKQAEAAEALLKQKYQDSRVKLAEAEATIQNAKASAKQTDLQLSHAKKLCDDLLREKETMREEARREVQKDMSNMQRDREREIERIYCRVQQAIDKKDATISALQKEIAGLKERCLKQDAIIRQQRIDYCIK